MPTTIEVPDPAQPPTTDQNGNLTDPWHRPPLASNPEKTEAAVAALRRPGVEVVEEPPPPVNGGETGATGTAVHVGVGTRR